MDSLPGTPSPRSPYPSRIRLILPKVAAAHPEVILLAGMFQHYRG